jgi:signal transduction histidine kinase
MVLVLAAAAVFVYLRLQSDLDEGVNATLEARVAAVRAAGDAAAGSPGEAEEGFAQLLSARGRVIETAGGADGPTLSRAEVRRVAAGGGKLEVERRAAGVEGTTRVIAEPADAPAAAVVAAGQTLEDRDETLAGVAASFAVGGPIAVLAASLLGYLLASAALRPVEAMRGRAGEVSLTGDDERLPLPAAHDEIRRLGETLNEMLARLRESFERERRFVADASHELRTPLAVLKTELESALRGGPADAGLRESLQAAVEETDHLAQLAEDLLLVARAADGRLPLRPETIRVQELLDGTRHRFGDRARSQGRDVTVEAPVDLEASLDPLRARQALGNLVDNALRHGAGDIRLSARRRDGALEIDVADQGQGFSSELAPRAFERFARGDAARSRGGTGLGLAIVSAIAEAHGGSATIAASGGERTVVRLRLPANAPAAGGR